MTPRSQPTSPTKWAWAIADSLSEKYSRLVGSAGMQTPPGNAKARVSPMPNSPPAAAQAKALIRFWILDEFVSPGGPSATNQRLLPEDRPGSAGGHPFNHAGDPTQPGHALQRGSESLENLTGRQAGGHSRHWRRFAQYIAQPTNRRCDRADRDRWSSRSHGCGQCAHTSDWAPGTLRRLKNYAPSFEIRLKWKNIDQ